MMTKVDLVTPWNERCGIAEYANDLVSNASDQTQFQIHCKLLPPPNVVFPFDIVHVNHEDGLFRHWTADDIRVLRRNGKRTILTKHNSFPHCRNNFDSAFDAVVVHEETNDGFFHIPHGIYDWKNPGIKPEMKIGTVGFPQAHKQFLLTAEVAKKLGVGLLVITAESPHGDALATEREIKKVYPEAEVFTKWTCKEEVASKMATCAATVFFRWSNLSGISGAVRLGLMSGRPCVITRDRQFHDLFEGYPQEVYVCESADFEHLCNVVSSALCESARCPNKILEDMSWKKCAEQYMNLYKRILA